MADRDDWERTRPRTQEDWDALLDAKRERIRRTETVLAGLVHEACPGAHALRVHRDSRPPWCDVCGRGARGLRVMDKAPGEAVVQVADLEVLVVSWSMGEVHRWQCQHAPTGRDALGWSPSAAGLDDKACPTCLPGGLPHG